VGDNILDIDIDFEDLGSDSVQLEKKKPKKVKSSAQQKGSEPKKSRNTKKEQPKKAEAVKPAKLKARSITQKPKPTTRVKSKKLTDVFGSAVKNSNDKKFHSRPKNRKVTPADTKLNNKNITSEDILVVRKKVNPAQKSVELPEIKKVEPTPQKPISAPKNLKPEPKLKHSGYSFGQLNHLANLVRQDILDMLYHAGSGHSAGSLDQVEIFVALYFRIMRHDPKDPSWSERDILVQSNGHTVPVRYAVMARAGYFPRHDLLSLRQFNSDLQGHPERERIPALETTSGPLGSGLSQAAGMALSLMMDSNKTRRVYCTMGDGELNEGNIWEAAMFAAKYKLGNLVGIVDRNNIQIDGYAEDVMPLENLREKWESFGWYVQEVDGNNIESVISALSLARSQTAKPNLIIAHTVPGKGVDFMEYDPAWHGKAPNEAQEKDAIKKLRTLDGKIEGGHL
jgi:transketolase